MLSVRSLSRCLHLALSRWEIDIEGVYIDGKRLPDSRIPANGVDSRRTSALLDTVSLAPE